MAFHPMMGNSYQLNSIGKKIITLLKQHKTKDEILEELAKEYDISENELFIDISDFMAKLKIYGLYQ
ncbi:MAG: PqqD family protein [Arcobacteraceae bacterium]|nr:PqqD family protein [Arcobacteraceae bacterium]